MISFHGKQEIKDFYLARIKAHALADEIVKGQYWENGKGCAVGCTIHSNEHANYEKEIGILRILARLEDKIFENLPNDLARTWPEKFIDAIPVGKDLSNIWPRFAIFILTDKTQCASRRPQCEIIANKYQQKLEGMSIAWEAAADAAASAAAADAAAGSSYAASAASYAASYAASAASYAYAAPYAYAYTSASYAASAADAASASSVAAAADASASYASAASYAASASADADASYAASAAARQKAYLSQSEKLLELLRDA